MRRGLGLCALIGLTASPLLAASTPEPCPPEAVEEKHYFPEKADARTVLAAALAQAKAEHKTAIVVFGGDWCHDSRGLARVLTSDAFKAEFSSRFLVTFIDVGVPQTGNGRNLDLVRQLGVKHLKSTPALFAIGPNGKRLNSVRDAISWRNADSRGAAAIMAWFGKFAADRAR